jgi:hypothetical protein
MRILNSIAADSAMPLVWMRNEVLLVAFGIQAIFSRDFGQKQHFPPFLISSII